MAQTAPGVLQLGEFTNYLYYGFCIAALAAAAFRSRRGLTLKDNTHFLAAATVACVTGSVAVLASASCANSYVATVLFLLGTPLASVGISIAMLAWYELLATMSIDYALLHYVTSCLLADGLRLLWYKMPTLPPTGSIAFVCFLPLASFACFVAGRREIRGLPYAAGEQVEARWDFPWMPVLLLGIFNLAGKFSLNLLDEGDKGLNALSGIVCYGALLLVVILGFKRFPYHAIRYAVLPLMLTGMLCQLNSADLVVTGMVVTRVAQDMVLAFVVSLLFNLSYRRGVNATWVFGLTLSCGNMGTLIANMLSVELSNPLSNKETATMAISALIVIVTVAFMVLASEKNLAGSWGITPSITASPADFDHEAAMAVACSRAARRYDLTRREEDVLLMRVRGASLKEVESALCITHNTLKCHVRHIYGKLGVSDIDEAKILIGLTDGQAQ